MLPWLAQLFVTIFHPLRVFQYITFRSIAAALTAFLIALLLSPKMIAQFKQYQINQAVRDDGPQSHLTKTGTPTMGGVLIVIAIVASVLLWGNLANGLLWLLLGVTIAFAWIGWVDDYRKVIQKNSRGLPARWKYFWQSVVALIAVSLLFFTSSTTATTQLVIPFFKHIMPNLGVFFIVLGYFVIVGSSNAVNLTDGLDGLAILPIALVAVGLGVFAYLTGNVLHAQYLSIPYIPGAGECVIFCSALAGASLAFLWFNTYPAEIFMGDVGSLALGAALGSVAVIARQEFVLFIMGGIFVAETLSVVLQVGSFKLRGRRIFKMAPLHHHFELKGWPEAKVVVRFWIITVILVLIGLATLKLR